MRWLSPLTVTTCYSTPQNRLSFGINCANPGISSWCCTVVVAGWWRRPTLLRCRARFCWRGSVNIIKSFDQSRSTVRIRSIDWQTSRYARGGEDHFGFAVWDVPAGRNKVWPGHRWVQWTFGYDGNGVFYDVFFFSKQYCKVKSHF